MNCSRTLTTHIRFNKDEHILITQIAKAQGHTFSSFVRNCAYSKAKLYLKQGGVENAQM